MHGWLTDAVINAAQTLLKRKYTYVGGRHLTFAIKRGTFVQILHVHGNHWITISIMFVNPMKLTFLIASTLVPFPRRIRNREQHYKQK